MGNKIIVQKLEKIESRISAIENQLKSKDTEGSIKSDPSKKLTIREFLISINTKDGVKRTLAVGYYLEKYNGMTSFNISDLDQAYERAKEKKPINMNDKINMNLKNGHMEEASEKKDNRKAWYITNPGAHYVMNDLSNK